MRNAFFLLGCLGFTMLGFGQQIIPTDQILVDPSRLLFEIQEVIITQKEKDCVGLIGFPEAIDRIPVFFEDSIGNQLENILRDSTQRSGERPRYIMRVHRLLFQQSALRENWYGCSFDLNCDFLQETPEGYVLAYSHTFSKTCTDTDKHDNHYTLLGIGLNEAFTGLKTSIQTNSNTHLTLKKEELPTTKGALYMNSETQPSHHSLTGVYWS